MNKKMGRPRKDPKHLRVNRTLRCHPNTWKELERMAKSMGMGMGECVDWQMGTRNK